MRKRSQATRLVEIADESQVELWSADHVPFATFWVDSHAENWPLRSAAFRRWLARCFYAADQTTPPPDSINAALQVLEGRAIHEGEEKAVHTRVAGIPGGGLSYLDLCDREWNVVEVGCESWCVLPAHEAPVRFRRARGMLPLPMPERGGSLKDLDTFLNPEIADEAKTLILAWLVGALNDRGPYPVLDLQGEQDSAKSTLARLLRRCIDPNAGCVRAQPRQERDLAIATRNGWVIAFDNVSRLADWLSDALCRVSYGMGFATRQLYSDDEEAIFAGARPILLNGIDALATRGDLLDRSLVVNLPRIRDEQRIEESSYWSRFEVAHPRILGALLDAVVTAIRNESYVDLDQRPRMADFARWIVAAEPALPWKQGNFLRAYLANRREAHELALDASPVSAALQELLRLNPEWRGTATELLANLGSRVTEAVRGSKDWPKRANSLSSLLKRLAPNLRSIGIEYQQAQRTESRREIVLTRRDPLHKADDRQDRQDRQGNGPDPDGYDAADEHDDLFPTDGLAVPLRGRS